MLFAIVLLLVVAGRDVAAMWPQSWVVGESCYHAATFNFDACNSQDIKCLCSNLNYLSTVALCIWQHSPSASQRDFAWDHFTYTVCKLADATASDENFRTAMAYLNYHKDNLTLVTAEPLGGHGTGGPTIASPAEVSNTTYEHVHEAVHNYLYQKDVSVWQGSFLAAYWLIICGLGIIGNFHRYMLVRFATRKYAMDRRSSAFTRWWQKHISIPAAFGRRHLVKLRILGIHMTIPTRLESLYIFVYFALNVVFMVVPYQFLKHDILYPTRWSEMMRFASDRSGIIGVIQLPVVTLFAMRNNVLMWMTGWSFADFNTYHRAIARVMYAQFIVHAVTKHVFSASYGASLVKYFYPLPYYRWGVAAMFLFALAISAGFVRAYHYEWFLRLHVACAIAAYICTIYHLRGLGYKQTVYVSFGIWAFDWLVRFLRLVFLNVSLFMQPVTGSKRVTFATMRVMSGDVVNVKVRTPKFWRPQPGQYVFIHVGRLRFWEAHPFSVVGSSVEGESFQLFCRARTGMTKRMMRMLTRARQRQQDAGIDPHQVPPPDADGALERVVLIEGPYGHHCPVERYNDVLVIAGGVGVTGTIPYVEHLARLRDGDVPARIVFVWAVRTFAETDWVRDRLDHISRSGRVTMRVYVSAKHASSVPSAATSTASPEKHDAHNNSLRPASSYSSYSRSPSPNPPLSTQPGGTSYHLGEPPAPENRFDNIDLGYDEKDSTLTLSLSRYESESSARIISKFSRDWTHNVHIGRPELGTVIRDFFVEATGAACVLACGPPPMMDSVRQSVVDYLDLNENGRVDYFEEAFLW